jgi:hypothetical protein
MGKATEQTFLKRRSYRILREEEKQKRMIENE